MRLVLVLILFCGACESKPVKEDAPVNSKATLNAPSSSVEIEAVVAYSPRRAQEIGDTVLLSPTVQSCLRAAPEVREAQFTVGLEGILSYQGAVEKLQVTTPSEALKGCLSKEIPALNFGRGRLGPFKMQVIRPPAGVPNTGKKSKAVLLDLSAGPGSGKKWE